MNPRSQSARLEVSRAIEAGGEIFVSYGAAYWESAESNTHDTFNVPDWEWVLSDPFVRACSALSTRPASCLALVSPAPDFPSGPSAPALLASVLLLECDPVLWVCASSVPLLQLDCDPELWLGDCDPELVGVCCLSFCPGPIIIISSGTLKASACFRSVLCWPSSCCRRRPPT